MVSLEDVLGTECTSPHSGGSIVHIYYAITLLEVTLAQ